MRYKYVHTLTAALLMAVMATVCSAGTGNQVADVGKTTRHPARTVRKYVESERMEYEKKAEERLERLQDRLVELKATAINKGGPFYGEHRAEIYKLRDLLRAERARLAVLKEAARDDWLDLQEGFDMVLEDLEHSFDKAAREYNK